ncbi:DUF1772 domain-containing protein [Thermostaphylospora chromogena]|uniref:Uncharacterized membrane protein n=1 Tax=Thermostaphylospora chromogena TaxID=35622 RepID=A0A1H1A7L2_9ACTN|nr:DUF1772 domain-containing protein [Thermostaphylospora chromogena]SDQ35708.1 Uncharacterized membrane protein [Thermostaphylospora chromogena]
MIVPLLGVGALVGSGIVAGVLFAVALSVVPAMRAMPPDRYVYTHQLLGRNWDPTMPLLVLTTAGADTGLAVTAPAEARVLFVAAAGCLLGVSLVSHLCNVPINRRVRRQDPGAIPPDWVDPRPAWRRWHLLRTALAVIALVLNSVATTLV